MPDNEKSLFSKFSIRNPFARIVYASTPLASAFFIELSKHLSNPDEQKVLISALTTAGIIAAPVASVAGNVLAEAISEKFFKRFSRNDILENGDLQKAVGDAICATILAIYDEQQSIFKQKQTGFYDKLKGFFQKEIAIESKSISINKDVLKKLSKVPTETWQKLIEELEKDKDKEFNLTIEEIEALYPRNLPDIFAIPAAKFNEVTALDKNTWEKVLRKLCRLEEIDTSNDKYPHFTHTIAYIAEVLVRNFPELLKHTLVSNIAKDGKAYANLQLKIMGEVLFYVREINNKLDTTNDKLFDIETQISDLREALTDGLSPYSNDFANQFNEIRNLIIQNQEIIIEAIKSLEIKVDLAVENTETLIVGQEIILDELSDIKKGLQTPSKSAPLPKYIAADGFPSPTNYFTGRGDVIEGIKAELKRSHRATLHGISGLGKTSVLLEFARRAVNDYKHIIFLRATRGNALSSFARLAERTDESAKKLEKDTDKAAIFKTWLEENDGWLLLIDNVDVPSEVKDFLPVNKRGDILASGNSPQITTLGNEVPIEKMTSESGALLLYRRAKTLSGLEDEEIKTKLENEPETEQTAVKKIVKEFDGLPLALNLAGAFVHFPPKTFADYVDFYEKYAHKLLAKQDINDDYQNDSVAKAFSLAYETISTPDNDTEEAKLIAKTAVLFLITASFLHPEAIPLEILIRMLVGQYENAEELAQDELFLDEVFAKIAQFDLFEKDHNKNTVSVHRLVLKVINNKIEADEKQIICSQILEILADLMPRYDYYNKEICERYFRQTETALENADNLFLVNEIYAFLYNGIGYYQYLSGNYQLAETFLYKSWKIFENVYGKEHQEIAHLLNDLALVYRSQGRYEEAIKKVEEALYIDEKVFGKDHPNYASDLNNLALIYRSQGRYEEAIEKYEEAIGIDEKTIGKEHPEYAIRLSNLASVYFSQNRYDEAIEKFEKAIEIDEKTIGNEHPDYATHLNNLASVYLSQNRYDEAIEKIEKAIEIDKKTIGEEHPDYATDLNNLASIYQLQKRYDEAIVKIEEALSIREKIFGKEHPDYGSSLNTLANIYALQEKYDEAVFLFEEAVRIFVKFLGENHPSTQTVKENLEICRNAMKGK